MYITVHRGTQQIGGNLIEIGTENTRLLFDAGANLPPLDGPKEEAPFQLEGLTWGEPAFDRVFLSHHHNDHCGLPGKLLPGIPVSAVRGLLGETGKPDLLITEGTNIRPGKPERAGEFQGEEWVKRRAAGQMRLYEGAVFVLCSSANEDRIRAISQGAAWAGRTVCEDLFQSAVRNRADETAQWFVAGGVDRDSRVWPYFEKLYRQRALVGTETLAGLPGKKAVFIRASMLSFLEKYMNARRRKSKARCSSTPCGRGTSGRRRWEVR